jgi:hypothetical protein
MNGSVMRGREQGHAAPGTGINDEWISDEGQRE